MAATIGSIFGAVVGAHLVSRFFLWLLRPLGATPRRILLAHGLTLAFGVVAGGYGFAAIGEGPQFTAAFSTYGPAVALWFVVDLVALRGRRSGKTPR